MGSDKSKKHKKRKHSESEDDSSSSSSSSGSSSSEERKAKKHKKDKKGKKEKKESKNKHKHHKHKSSEKSSDKELVKQAKEFLKQQLAGSDAPGGAATAVGPRLSTDDDGLHLMPPPPPRPPRPAVAVEKPITSAAYFERAVEFTAWLLEARRLYFNDLSTERSRELFEDFVEQWNAGQLDGSYYAGQIEAPKRRTQHVWSFAGKGGEGPSGASKGPIGVAAFMAEQQDQRDSKRASDQLDRRKERRDREQLLDEVLPKATGREAQVEKRVARREDARARAASPDAHIPGGRGDMMGGDDSFAAAKARESQQQQFRQGKQVARNAELNVKLAAFQAAEDAKMEQFRKLAAQGPITIAKRQPPPG